MDPGSAALQTRFAANCSAVNSGRARGVTVTLSLVVQAKLNVNVCP